ncbi:MAG: energy-coupling factor transporter ATPase [Clostridia bacterium]|nr:energy-coupling factor transporter ATPase [Clostridia bacterium]
MILKTENLEYSYTEGKPTLKGLNIEIPEGQYVAILGHNGSGKSTLLKHFNAILLPTGGKVYVSGMDTSNEELLFEIRTRCGMVFQNPDNQIVATITEEDVAFGPENLGVPNPELRARVDEALKTVGMYEFRSHAPHMLSGGQKQRIAIAGIIAMRPSCIALDEPTAMLDPIGRRDVLDTIAKLNREENITVLLITHHMEEALFADRVIVMDEGTVALDGTPCEIFAQVEKMESLGLTVPNTVKLMHTLQSRGLPADLNAVTTDKAADFIARILEDKIG